ncbi:MAG TPA: hypothetical protein PKD48_03490, partial [Sphingopyxis sp.]|nr:hypothetical protein [Sphingopyxis sp.]
MFGVTKGKWIFLRLMPTKAVREHRIEYQHVSTFTHERYLQIAQANRHVSGFVTEHDRATAPISLGKRCNRKRVLKAAATRPGRSAAAR